LRTGLPGLEDLAIRSDGRIGAVSGERRGILFDIASAKATGVVEIATEGYSGCDFATDDRIVFGNRDSSELFGIGGDGIPADRPAKKLPGPGEWVRFVSPNHLLSAPVDGVRPNSFLVRTELSTGKELLRVPLPAEDIWIDLALSKPRGEVAVLCHSFGTYVHRVDLAKGEYVAKNPGHHMRCLATAFSPDGRWLATGGKDRAVYVWEVATGKQVQGFRNLPGEVFGLAFDPVHRQLVAGLSNGDLYVWKLDKWNLSKSIPAHSGAINGIAFTSSGRFLVTGGADGRVHLWNTANWTKVDSLVGGHPDGVRSIVALDDGQRFATTGNNGFVRVHSRPVYHPSPTASWAGSSAR